MPNDGFQADTVAITDAASRLRKLTGDMSEVAAYVVEADPEWWMWGVTGLAFSQQYEFCADGIREVLDKFAPAAEGIAERIRQCADSYDEADQCVADDLNGLADGIEGPTGPRGNDV